MPVELIVDTKGFEDVAARFAHAAAEAVPIIEAGFAEAASAVSEIGVDIMRDHTPVRSGRLQDSTVGDVAAGGMEATITIRQPATSLPGPGGRGGGVEYVDFVVRGRGEIFPVDAKALASTDGFGPVKHAGAAAANNYPSQAIEDMRDPIDALMAERANAAAEKIVASI